jgi:hypothetical protein
VQTSTLLYDRLRNDFNAGIDFADRTDAGNPPLAKPVLELGYDGKMWLTWLAKYGPLRCQLWASPTFSDARGEAGRGAPPANKVVARVPAHDPKQALHLENVAIVATRRGESLKGGLREAAIEADRVDGVLDCDYLLRKDDAAGNPDASWGDGGFAWIAHRDLRQILRWAYASVPAHLLNQLGIT